MDCKHSFTHVITKHDDYYGGNENKPEKIEKVTVYCTKCGKITLNNSYQLTPNKQ